MRSPVKRSNETLRSALIFPTMNDALKSGSVDAVLTAEPFITRIEKAGNGEVAARSRRTAAVDQRPAANEEVIGHDGHSRQSATLFLTAPPRDRDGAPNY